MNTEVKKIQEELAALQVRLTAALKAEKEGKPWRADVDEGEEYWYVDSEGDLQTSVERDNLLDDVKYKAGNYFQTDTQATASLIYKVLNDEWHYWVAGVTEFPDSIPDGCEVLDSISRLWKAEANNCPTQWNNSPRRWLKH